MSNATTVLRGIAWNHTRGFLPMVATAQRFEELHPEISIRWEKRSLRAFGDAALAELAANYDLIVMDHPHTALAATQNLLLPFDDWLPAEFIAEQAANSVGASHASYCYANKQWALAIDAAAPITTCRTDLLEKHGLVLPRTWDDVLALARRGHVSVSAFPVDVLMYTYMFCDALGVTPFTRADCLAPDDVLAAAIAELHRLVSLCDPQCLERNPIRTAEWMTATDDPRAAYCPLAFGYSNYSRPGYARHALKAQGLVMFGNRRLRATLGGAGLAVSSRTKHPRACMDYSQYCASPGVQKGIYFQSGGQPGHRAAWTDDTVNEASLDFFRDTLETLDEALLRGKFPGYMRFQDEASPIVHQCVSGATRSDVAARDLNHLYRECYSDLEIIA
jgi:multiple sugar transport system substrate-binding protein